MTAGPVAVPPVERVEQKFFVPPQCRNLAFALLRRTCRADGEHPADQVNSLYFDTPGLEQHERSLAGEHTRDKVRIRWYGEDHDPHRANGAEAVSELDSETSVVPAWLELKSRRGFASTKQRLQLEVPAAALANAALRYGIVPADVLQRAMACFGFFPRCSFHPVVAISYRRYRFIEPQTGFRISIDSRIRSTIVMPGIGRGERALELPGAVVEVKGPTFDVPPALRQIADLGSSWTRYSKYSSSLEGHAAAGGSVARLWPSGMLYCNT